MNFEIRTRKELKSSNNMNELPKDGKPISEENINNINSVICILDLFSAKGTKPRNVDYICANCKTK